MNNAHAFAVIVFAPLATQPAQAAKESRPLTKDTLSLLGEPLQTFERFSPGFSIHVDRIAFANGK